MELSTSNENNLKEKKKKDPKARKMQKIHTSYFCGLKERIEHAGWVDDTYTAGCK